MKKLLLYISIFIYLIYPNNSFFIVEAKESAGNVEIRAEIPAIFFIRIFGYTSPFSIVQVIGVKSFGQTTTDRLGYFIFNNLPISSETQEICLTTLDSEKRIGFPLCVPINTNKPQEYGPLLLSPTVSLSNGFFWEREKAVFSGKTIPSSPVDVSFFKSEATADTLFINTAYASGTNISKTNSNPKGDFNMEISQAGAGKYRIFAKAFYENSPTLKSQTLVYTIGSNADYFIRYVLVKIIFLILLAGFLIWAAYREKKSKLVSKNLAFFIETIYLPYSVRLRLGLRRQWYNFREFLKSRQK